LRCGAVGGRAEGAVRCGRWSVVLRRRRCAPSRGGLGLSVGGGRDASRVGRVEILAAFVRIKSGLALSHSRSRLSSFLPSPAVFGYGFCLALGFISDETWLVFFPNFLWRLRCPRRCVCRSARLLRHLVLPASNLPIFLTHLFCSPRQDSGANSPYKRSQLERGARDDAVCGEVGRQGPA
jgi:hypothetical protein